jgi:hypothetical protein
MRRSIAAGLLLAACVSAQRSTQPEVPVDPLIWATATAGTEFSRFENTVVSAHAMAQLSALVCRYDKGTGNALFAQTLRGADSIKIEVFTNPKEKLLPVNSLTGLLDFIEKQAVKCDPTLQGLMDAVKDGAFKQRLKDERVLSANNLLGAAMGRYEADPDRAAQLVDLVFETADSATIDFEGLSSLLALLRARAPELSDRLFVRALDAVSSREFRSTRSFAVLGKYLFVSPAARAESDAENRFEMLPVDGGSTFNFGMPRQSANTELVTPYVQRLLRLIDLSLNIRERSEHPEFDPQSAMYLAQSLVPAIQFVKSNDQGPLKTGITRLQTAYGSQIRLAPEAVFQSATQPDDSIYRRVREVFPSLNKKEFDEARRQLNGVLDTATTAQVAPVIEFARALDALRSGDAILATRTTGQIQPGGVRRALLYTAIIHKVSGSTVDSTLSLALRETNTMPHEIRAAVLSALATALFPKNPQRMQAPTILIEAVRALNAAQDSPRSWRFDPRPTRNLSSNTGRTVNGANLDVPGIQMSVAGFTQVIDTGQGRIVYALDVPDVGPFTVAEAFLKATTIPLTMLEAIAKELLNERERAGAFLSIAELRFEAAKSNEPAQ